MFHRNGFVLRTAYPNGFPGDEVDICSTLRLFVAAIWRKTTPSLQKVWKFFLNYFIGPFFWLLWTTIGTAFLSLCGIFANGTIRFLMWCDGYPFEREMRIPFLYKIGNVRPLPLLWVVLAMLAWCLFSLLPLFMFLLSRDTGVYHWIVGLSISLFYPYLVWTILNGSFNRERLTKKTEEVAPFFAQKVEEFPRVRNVIEVLMLLRLSIAGWRENVCIKVKVKD